MFFFVFVVVVVCVRVSRMGKEKKKLQELAKLERLERATSRCVGFSFLFAFFKHPIFAQRASCRTITEVLCFHLVCLLTLLSYI